MVSKAYQIKNYILEHPKEHNQSIADKYFTTRKYVDKCRRQIKEGNLSLPRTSAKDLHKRLVNKIDVTVDQELLERQQRSIEKDYKKRIQELLYRLDVLNEKYDEALALKEYTDVDVPTIKINGSVGSQAVPIIQFSDWHVEEKIERATTYGLNEYNPDIARSRAGKLAVNTLKLLKKERQDVTIDEMFICLGGDFINNYLHDHDVQMNFMSPIEACLYAKELLKQTLVTIAENAQVKKIVLMCIRGNHGRLTKRMQSSNDYKMNLEAILYHMLKQELNDSMFEWHIPESELGYADVLGKRIRSFHGHQVSYQGGVGDLTIPLNKAVMKWDKTDKADWNLMHHYHSYWMPMRNSSLNGSMCGWNSYALSIGAPYEPASQTFHLLDAKRGFTMRTKIECE
jgi:hypothetical protein